ncbi:MAG: aminopeptidase P family protein [Candidatus Nanopelagicus sp.]
MNSGSNSNNNEKVLEERTHDIPTADAMTEFMKQGWASINLSDLTAHQSITYTKVRREKLSKQYLGKRLIFPAGSLKVRSNDSDYQFRAHSAFSWFTGIVASDCVPDSVFIMEPTATGHDDLLFIHPRSPRDNDEFYKNTRYGEFWVGRRMTLEETQVKYELPVRQIESIAEFLQNIKDTLIVRGEDMAIDKLIPEQIDAEKEFLNYISVMRLVKDQYEIEQMQKAVDASVRGFADMVRVFPAATSVARGERVIEAAFYGRARLEGNDNGYPSIVAAGSHACVLHWIRNDGDVLPGDLVLIDAGVEVESHYTADITRTFPINGKFTEAQRKIYMIVYKAQQAGIAAVKPGAKFKDFHNACMAEIAKGAFELGVLPMSAEDSLKPENGLHRRWQFHGSGHHLGIDVHDCAHARKEQYADAVLEPGMILTVEPGFYIQPDDTLFPQEYRGIGVRIEDDILVTESGAKILSNALPRHPDEVEAYMAKLLK